MARPRSGRLARGVRRSPPDRRLAGPAGGGGSGRAAGRWGRRGGRSGPRASRRGWTRATDDASATSRGREPRVRGSLRFHLHRLRHREKRGRDARDRRAAVEQLARRGAAHGGRGAAKDHANPTREAARVTLTLQTSTRLQTSDFQTSYDHHPRPGYGDRPAGRRRDRHPRNAADERMDPHRSRRNRRRRTPDDADGRPGDHAVASTG